MPVRDAVFANAGECTAEGVTLRLWGRPGLGPIRCLGNGACNNRGSGVDTYVGFAVS